MNTPQGRRVDELKDGPAATDALSAEAQVEATEHAGRARRKMAARDFQGAVTDFTTAIDRYGNRASFLDRAEAKLALGDIDGAIADCKRARSAAGTDAEYRLADQKLRDFQQRRVNR